MSHPILGVRPRSTSRIFSQRSHRQPRNQGHAAGKLDRVRAAKKTLLFDLDTLGIPLDNVEGMTLGPTLPDGRRALVLVSDNNFAANQFTQFLLFALG